VKPLLALIALAACRSSAGDARAPHFTSTSTVRFEVEPDSQRGQRLFNQALTWGYAGNRAEARRSFEEAERFLGKTPMTAWGVAWSFGPDVQGDRAVDLKAAREAVERALARASGADERQRAYVDALARRYTQAGVDAPAYAEAMRELARRFPDDVDARVLLAEALLLTGDERDARRELAAARSLDPLHPGACRLTALVEEDTAPAIECADELMALDGCAGGFAHAAAQAYARAGRGDDALRALERAAAADVEYAQECRRGGFEPTTDFSENVRVLWAAASRTGRAELAIDAASSLAASLSPERLRANPALEELTPARVLALARFGRWDDVLRAPLPAPERVYATGATRFARGRARIGQGDLSAARAELEELAALAADPRAASLTLLSGANAGAVLDVCRGVLAAELAAASGDRALELAELARAADKEAELPPLRPRPWSFPLRPRVGRVLLEADRAVEAEAVFRSDLEVHPHRAWSLYGLEESLRARGEDAAARDVRRAYEASHDAGEEWADVVGR
jgi:tetratricopeptide (TPR) repeat protein